MGVTILVHLILALPVVTLCSPDQWVQQIYVDNKTGVDDPSCWEGDYSTPCLSLNLALTGAQLHYNHSTIIFLQPGQHQLHSGSETQLKNMSQLAIVGNGSQGEVVIRCEPLAGLAFYWSNDIDVTNVSLVGCTCGMHEFNTRHDYFGHSALLFASCKEINLTNVNVDDSSSTGVTFYNPAGVVYISECQISCSKGGGLVIETTDESPQSFSATITNSVFSHNTASSGQFPFHSLNVNPFGLGRGGGISMVFGGGTVNNTVRISNVHLNSNRAQFGGGLYLAFYGNTSGNVVSIDGAQVTRNEALLETGSLLVPASSGGGVFIGLAVNNTGFPFDNIITISDTVITSNTAETGGGMTVDVLSNSNGCTTAGNKLVIEKCVFDENVAFQGASAYLSQSSKTSQTLLDTTVCCSNFTNGHCSFTLTQGLPCSGNLLLEYYTLNLKDKLVFISNNVSAISLHSSFLKLSPLTQLQFIKNRALNGAALHIADCSSVSLNNGSEIFFKSNVASHHGGAIYAESCNHGLTTAGGNCAIRHNDSALHPNDWAVNITFEFDNNFPSDHVNSVYIDSIRYCKWPNTSHPDKHNTFCWKGWNYVQKFGVKGNCLDHLMSSPTHIVNLLPRNFTLYPGNCINLRDNFIVRNDWGYDITSETILEVDVLFGTARVLKGDKCKCIVPQHCSVRYYNDFVTRCTGNNNLCNNHQVLLLPDSSSSNDSSLVQLPGVLLNVNFRSCVNGTVFNSSQGCSCEYSAYSPVCFKKSSLACTDCMDDDCNMYTNSGGMCGSCNDTGYGVAINSPNLFICTVCPWYGVAVFMFIGLVHVPILIMMIVLAVLHINITNGNLNWFVLYSQIISSMLLLPNNFNFGTLQLEILSVYSIWNFNFLTLFPSHFCIKHIDTAARVISIQYIIAACPLLFIAVTYTWIQWYNNGYRFVLCITRPLHLLLIHFWRRCDIQPSLIDTYAGLLLLSYMCFLTTSTKLLQFIALEQNSSAFKLNNNSIVTEHAVLGVTAVLCLLLFVVPLMVLLLFYHLKIFQRCLTWCKLDRPGLHALVDAYQGCFKNIATDGKERRYFAGIYLLFRICFLASSFVLISSFFNDTTLADKTCQPQLAGSETSLCFVMSGLVVILQPYKKTAHNVIDFLILLFMTVIYALKWALYSSAHVCIPSLNTGSLLPLLGLICYLVMCCLKRTCCYCVFSRLRQRLRNVHNTSSVGAHISVSLDQMPLLVPPTTSVVSLDDQDDDDDDDRHLIHCGEQPNQQR